MKLELETTYIGIQAYESIAKLKQDEEVKPDGIQNLYSSCQGFFTVLANDILKRFDFSDKLFEFISVVDPIVAQNCEITSLIKVFKRFPMLSRFVKVQDVDELRKHATLDYSKRCLNQNDPAEKNWKKVFLLKNQVGDFLFSNLKQVFNILLCLPFSNASVQRKFRNLKNIKTFNRNRLGNDTIVSLLSSQEGIKKAGGSLKLNVNNDLLKKNLWN